MKNYLEKYNIIKKDFPALQENAIESFSRLGFPNPKNEEWKYTHIAPIIKNVFSFSSEPPQLTKYDIENKYPFVVNENFIVVENGKLNYDASSYKFRQEEILFGKANELYNNPLVKEHFGKYADLHIDSFAALNTAFSNEALVIIFKKNIVADKHIYVLNISTQNNSESANRLLVVAEKNAKAKITWISDSAASSVQSFINAVNEIVVSENANLEFNILQQDNVSSFQICNSYVYQLKNSGTTLNTITTGGSIIRNKLHIKLDDSGCESHLNGLYLADGSQLMDNHTAVFHSKPNCMSNQLYKGILAGSAHGVFNGKILVERDAQKTNAYQSNKNILMSNDAVINAKPQLEIFADDVKCTHGATTGQMDDEALFYLRTRGISERNAKAMLVLAFARDVLKNISDSGFQDYVRSRIELKLNNKSS